MLVVHLLELLSYLLLLVALVFLKDEAVDLYQVNILSAVKELSRSLDLQMMFVCPVHKYSVERHYLIGAIHYLM